MTAGWETGLQDHHVKQEGLGQKMPYRARDQNMCHLVQAPTLEGVNFFDVKAMLRYSTGPVRQTHPASSSKSV